MKDILYVLVLAGFLVIIGLINMRLLNVEKQLERIENNYQAIVTENQQLRRINDQNLLLLAEGGWK